MNCITKHIPNAITCGNLLSGCMACLSAFEGNFTLVGWWIAIASLCDFADGLAARVLHAYSDLGKELDSLADVVSFGVAPGILVYTLTQSMPQPALLAGFGSYLPYIAFLIPIFSALRLAKFNIDTRQSDSFLGIPVPANALFWVGATHHIVAQQPSVAYIYPLVILFCYLLVCEIPMLSLKFKGIDFKRNYLRYLLIAAGAIFILLLQWQGLAAMIGFYILLSVVVASTKR